MVRYTAWRKNGTGGQAKIMSDDLISRKMVLEKLKVFSDRKNGNEHFLFGIETAIEIIENEPVAFDKEKVIDELKSAENYLYVNGLRITNFKFIHPLTAVEIVEKGGIQN